MLQCIAGAQQGSTSSAKLPSSAAVALQQQQLQQLLCQHQLRQQHHLKQQPFQPSQNGFQAALSPHKPASTVPRPPFGSWPWQQPAAAASSAQPDLPVQFSLQHPAGEPSVQSMLDQQLCPQLDGSYLAECIKSSASLLCTPSQYQSLQVPPQMPPPSKHLSTCHPSANTGFPGEKAEIEPSVSIVSPTTSFQSLPSANSTLTAKHEADLPAELHSADGSFEAIGEFKDYYSLQYIKIICVVQHQQAAYLLMSAAGGILPKCLHAGALLLPLGPDRPCKGITMGVHCCHHLLHCLNCST